jgi:hypothetical protein
MRKTLGFALATVLTLATTALAEEGSGRSIILDNGTTITVSEKAIADLAPGAAVPAMFETMAGPESRQVGSESRSTLSWGPSYGTQMDSIQAE